MYSNKSKNKTSKISYQSVSGVFVGHLIGALFAVVFVLANMEALPSALRIPTLCIVILIFILSLYGSFITPKSVKKSEAAKANFSQNSYWTVFSLQFVALFGGIRIISLLDTVAAVGWVALVVGVHFLALSLWWMQRNLNILFVGIGMTALGVVGLVMAFGFGASTNQVGLVAGIGSAIVLMLSSGVAAYHAIRTYKNGEKV